MLPFEMLKLQSAPLWRTCESSWSWAPPRTTHFGLWFAESGRGDLWINDQYHEVTNGNCFVFEPGCRLSGTHDPLRPLRVFSCSFTLQGWTGAVLWSEGALARDTSLFVLSAHRAQLLWQRGDEIGRELARRGVEQIVLSLWDEAQQSWPSAQERELDELIGSIRNEPARSWNLDDMARAVHLSRAQFVRRFRARFSCTPMEFVSRIRLQRAQLLLRESEMSLDSVARAVGYGDGPFLSKNFKRVFGTSPGAWRKLAKNSEIFYSSPIDSDK